MKPTDTRCVEITEYAIAHFKGQATELESAIGMLYVGRHFGWRVMYLIHSRNTISKYEKILGINVKEEFPELGPRSDKSLAWRAAKTMSNYWKIVKGEITGIKTPEID